MYRPLVEIDLEAFEVDATDDKVRMAMTRALNRVADRARTKAARAILEQVNFPASYLNPSQGRLTVVERARRDKLEALISGRDASTSLARFATSRVVRKQRGGGVQIQVAKDGRKKRIKRGFLINLRGGNIGLAVRTNDGQLPEGAYEPKEIGKNLFLLYGPSVDQALMSSRDGDGVYADITPETALELEREFARQLNLLGV